MSRLFISCALLSLLLPPLLAVPAAAETLHHTWSKDFGDWYYQDAIDVAVDPSGNIYLLGTNWGTIDFGGGPLTTSGGCDIVLAKLDPDGNHVWSREFGDASFDTPRAIALRPDGTIVITGTFEGGIDFGGGALTSAGDEDVFLAVLDGADGSHVWSQSFGAAGNQITTSVAVDASGSIYLGGYFEGSLDLGGGALVSAGGYDVFVARFGGTGAHAWSFACGDASFQSVSDIVVHPMGQVVVTGQFQGAVNFGGGTLTSAGSSDVFVAAYNAAGAHLWSRSYGDTSGDAGRCLSVDSAGNIVLAGTYSGTIFTGGFMLTSTDALDIFLARLDAGGTLTATGSIGGAGSQLVTGLALDSHDYLLITGEFYTEIDLRGVVLTGTGNSDIFLAKFDPAWTHVWGAAYGGSAYQWPGKVVTDGSRNVIMYASSEQAVDLGGGMLPHGGGGATDHILAKYGLDTAPQVTAVTDVGNDQGRQVTIDFQASTLDVAGSLTPILQYEAFRRVDDLPRAGATARDAGGPPMVSDPGILAEGWTYVGAVPAHVEPSYSLIAPTLADSTAGEGVHWSVFFIRAATAQPSVFFDSPPDSGYSVDNLAPGVPAGIVAAYAPDAVTLDWEDAPEEDFRYYRIYRGEDPGFTPSPENLVHETAVSACVDEGAAPWGHCYKITALDHAGNESEPGAPATVTEVRGDDVPARTALLGAVPNPFNPSTEVHFTLAAAGRVRLTVHDLAGRLVRTLADGQLAAGRRHVGWNGCDDAGRQVSSGVYVCRLETAGHREMMRMVLVK